MVIFKNSSLDICRVWVGEPPMVFSSRVTSHRQGTSSWYLRTLRRPQRCHPHEGCNHSALEAFEGCLTGPPIKFWSAEAGSLLLVGLTCPKKKTSHLRYNLTNLQPQQIFSNNLKQPLKKDSEKAKIIAECWKILLDSMNISTSTVSHPVTHKVHGCSSLIAIDPSIKITILSW